MSFTISTSPRVRPSPYYHATIADGVTSFTTYNHMMMPTGYGDPMAEYWRLINGVAMWDVAVERQVQQATGVGARFSTIRGQAFDAMRQLSQDGRRFDLVISDPPAFAPTKGALDKGLRAYETAARLAAGLTRPGGYLALCSCSHAATLEHFSAACAAGVRKAGRSGALIHVGRAGPDHPAHFALPETSYLKALFYRLD